MTISVVQTAKGTGTSLSFSSSTTAGNCVVVFISDVNISATPSVTGVTLGGSAGNFAVAASATNTGSFDALCACWADPNCAGGQTAIAVTMSNSAHPVIIAYEIAGLATTSVVDKTSTNHGTAASWSSLTTATTTQAAEIWIGGACVVNTAPTGPASPWSNISQASSTTDAIAGSQIVSSTGTATYSGTNGGSNGWASVVVTFKASGITTVSLPVAQVTVAAPVPGVQAGPVGLPVAAVTVAALAPSAAVAVPLPVARVTVAVLPLRLPVIIPTAQVTVKAWPPAPSVNISVALPTVRVTVAALPVRPQVVPKLLISLASKAGSDDYGTAFPQGIYAGAGLIQGPQIIADDTTGQILIYSGAPALGNLIASISAMSGNDGFGNPYQAGFTVYDVANGTWAQMDSGALNFANGATISNAVSGLLNIDNNGVAGIEVNSNTDEIALNASQVNANGNSLTGLFGLLDPSGYPLSSSASLTAVIATLNSTIQRLQAAGIFQ